MRLISSPTMKQTSSIIHTYVILRWFLLLCLTLFLSVSISASEIDYYPLTDEYAIEFLKDSHNADQSDEAQVQFINEKQIVGKTFKDAFRVSVSNGEILLDEGVSLDSEYFPELLKATRIFGVRNAEEPYLKYQQTALKIAFKYISTNNRGNYDLGEAFKTFLSQEKVKGVFFKEAVRDIVEQGKMLFTDNDMLLPDNPNYFRLLAINSKLDASDYHIQKVAKSPIQRTTETKVTTKTADKGIVKDPSVSATQKVPKSPVPQEEKTQGADKDELDKQLAQIAKKGYEKGLTFSETQRKELSRIYHLDINALEAAFVSQKLPKATEEIYYASDGTPKKRITFNFDQIQRTILGLGITTFGKDDEILNHYDKGILSEALTIYNDPQNSGTKGDGIIRFFQVGFRKNSPYKTILNPLKMGDDGSPELDADGNQIHYEGLFLSEADSSTNTFVEFLYSNRWAWNPERICHSISDDEKYEYGILSILDFSDKESRATIGPTNNQDFSFVDKMKRIPKYLDFDFRLSYDFSDSADNEKIDTAKVVGTSDISMEVNLGAHLFRHPFKNKSAFAVTAEIGYGLSTDRSAFDTHGRFFWGIGYAASFASMGGGDRAGLFRTRIGKARLDTIAFDTDANTEDNLAIRTKVGGIPEYQTKEGIAFESELIYPIGPDSLITFGASIYKDIEPDVWSVQIAYSRPISSLLDGIFALGSSGDVSKPLTPKSQTVSKATVE